jgi:hypothetical protein
MIEFCNIDAEDNVDFKSKIDLSKEPLEVLQFCEKLLGKLNENGEISLVDNEILKNIKEVISSQNNIIIQKNNRSNISSADVSLNENAMAVNQIKMTVEKIQNKISGKSEYEYISDYFLNANEHDEYENVETQESTLEPDRNKIPSDDINFDLNNLNVESKPSQRLCDLLCYTSNKFLKEKIKLDDEEIKILKGEAFPHADETLNISPQPPNKDNNVDLSLPNLRRKKELIPTLTNKQSANDVKKDMVEFDKEMEEEINNEIFGYTKNMKEHGKAFYEALQRDLKDLNNIEKIQQVDKIKTDEQLRNLNQFNRTLTIGFWRLLLLILIVISTFITTLLVIRIFPRLV